MLYSMQLLDQTPLTLLLVLKNTEVHSRIRWSNFRNSDGHRIVHHVCEMETLDSLVVWPRFSLQLQL